MSTPLPRRGFAAPNGTMQVEVVVIFIVWILIVQVLRPRIRPVQLVLFDLLLQRGDFVREPLLLRLVEHADLLEFAVEEGDEKRVRARRVRARADKSGMLVRLEVMEGLLEADFLLLELVDVFLQRLIAARGRYS